ncbi:MAG TPA: hypothetical protein VGY58_22445 [Gemmataceae bacterium]|nr:hypothetical protein [Gemmataceae bacterium]
MIGSPLLIAEKARARLQAILAAARDGSEARQQTEVMRLPDPADLVITPCEVGPVHGTGTLLLRIFADSSSIISLRTHDYYDVKQEFGGAVLCLPLAQSARAETSSWLRWYVAGTSVRRILCLPYTPAEPTVALAAREMLGVPLCTYIMDDPNVCAHGIPDELMHELLAKSRLRLVISPEMRNAYEKKYRMRFWVLPPVVAEQILRRTPVRPRDEAGCKRGVLLGNIWGQRWLDLLREVFAGGDVEIDWYCNQKKPHGLNYDRAELARDGIHQRDPVAEDDLPEVLAGYHFAVVPTDLLDGQSPLPVRAIAEFSLPSRMVTLMAVGHVPMLVLGSPSTCAASFVRRMQLGTVAPYERVAARSAIEEILAPEVQAAIRERAATLSGRFTADGVAEWIWRSLDAGKAATLDYEELMANPSAFLSRQGN